MTVPSKLQHSRLQPDLDNYPVQVIFWEKPDPIDSPSHTHQFDEILFIFKGGGHHRIAHQQHIVETSTVAFIPSGTQHLMQRDSTSSGFTIAYDPMFLESQLELPIHSLIFYTKPIKYQYTIVKQSMEKIQFYHDQLMLELQQVDHSLKPKMYLNFVNIILIETMRGIRAAMQVNHPRDYIIKAELFKNKVDAMIDFSEAIKLKKSHKNYALAPNT